MPVRWFGCGMRNITLLDVVVVVVVWPDGLGHAPTTSSKPALLFFFILSGDTADLTTRKTQKRPQLVGKYK